MHLDVIIHFTEFETTAIKSLQLAFTGKTLAGSKNYFPMGKGLCAKSHALTLSTFHSSTANSTNTHKIKKKNQNQTNPAL